MLSAQEIANYLEAGLDAIAATKPNNYQFSILAEIGRGYDGKKINGMVRTVSAELSPIPTNCVEAKYVFVVEMFISGSTNYTFINVNDIINDFINANQCTNVDFENGKGLMTFSMGVPKSYKVSYELGSGVPLTFTINVTFTENAVASGDKHWLLDGSEIPYLSESVYVEREGMTRKLFTDAYNKTILTGQTKFYSFHIPYESSLYKSLQAEILNSTTANGVKHTLTYYDGAAFTKDAPFTATVRIYRTAKSEARRPDGSVFEVTFTDVYNAENYSHKYYIALIDFPFDMQGDDTRYFNSTAEQVDYFEEKAAASSAPFVEIEAPNLDSLVITKQVYGNSGAPWASQFDFVNKNYAVIKAVSGDKTYYFYYFITNSTIGADGFVMVDLKLDTVQTYFFDENITFSDCLIERAHLNRFVPVEDDPTKVKFVTDPASKIYNSEQGLNFPKRLVKRDKLKLRYTGNDVVDEWLNENVASWVYVFIDPSHQYTVAEIRNPSGESDTVEIEVNPNKGRVSYPIGFNGATNCICYPIYKNVDFDDDNYPINKILLNVSLFASAEDNFNMPITHIGRQKFEKLNSLASYYYTIKLSLVPPFDSSSISANVDNNNNLIIDATTIAETVGTNIKDRSIAYFGGGIAICTSNTVTKRWSDIDGLFFGSRQTKTFILTNDYALSENSEIFKNEIKAKKSPNPAFNPKLNSQNFKELVITASSGDTFAYDIQKLGENSIAFEYSEPIQPEVTKYYMRVQGGTGLYEDDTDKNYTGLVGSTDNSLAYTNDQYAAFIANNKNFFLQSNMKIVSGLKDSVVSGAKSGTAGGPMGAIAGAAEGLISGASQAATSIIDREMTIDNLKAAPDQLKNANGNVIFNMFSTDLGLYIEKHSALEGDLKTANDFMNIYGFSFSGIANVKDYANIRKYHNYLKAQLQSINGNLSNVARSDLRQRFANGVRFWNSDVVAYNYENYENWLDSGANSFEDWLENKNIPLGS